MGRFKEKLAVVVFCLILLTGLASSAFYVMEDGERKRVAPAEQAQRKASPQSPVSSSGSGLDPSDFVNVTGDTLQGDLNMAGFGLTGLPSPDDPSDAATKKYVDENAVNSSNISIDLGKYATKDYVDSRFASDSSNSSVDLSGYATEAYVDEKVSNLEAGNSSVNLSEVVSNGNVLDRRILLPDGFMLGKDSRAVENSFALGRGAVASAENSFAIGQDASVNSSDTVSLGSNSSEMSLRVSGNISVDGEFKGLEREKEVWAYSFAADKSGTEVMVPEEVGRDYAVSVTPVGTLTETAVFNKTSEDFVVKVGEFTEVDVMLTDR